ncbi:MAG: hypothetical protein IGS49_25990 [Chlorogloeopsis fritschii C42_A2020_084]|nr:hypothetical protein [Chlorogloeopsis fritschii]MBF2008803.1 hypothetical protein [Chlorogloeopsis fritschii C42_A2020_084]
MSFLFLDYRFLIFILYVYGNCLIVDLQTAHPAFQLRIGDRPNILDL